MRFKHWNEHLRAGGPNDSDDTVGAVPLDTRQAHDRMATCAYARIPDVDVDPGPQEFFELSCVLRASEERFRALATFSPLGIFLNDAHGNCVYTNERCQDIFGLPADQLLDDGWRAGVHPDDRAGVFARWRQACGEEIELTDEFRVLRHDGELRHVRTHVRPIVVEGQPPSGFVGCVEDVTERKRAKEALIAAKTEAERARNAKSSFLTAVSHDLGQPLGALALYVGLLERKLGTGDEPMLDSMKACVVSLNGLVRDLLELGKLEAGVITPNVGEFVISDMVARLLATHAPTAELKGVSLRFRSCSLIACTDAVLYARIVGNLISNALRYTERGGVLIGCRRHDDSQWIEVWDTGKGVPEEMVGEIFEEYRQLGGGEPFGGSGLGLAIVAREAALLGLRIRVRSRVGRGSMFAVELPVLDEGSGFDVRRGPGIRGA